MNSVAEGGVTFTTPPSLKMSDVEGFVSAGDIDGLCLFCEETELKVQ